MQIDLLGAQDGRDDPIKVENAEIEDYRSAELEEEIPEMDIKGNVPDEHSNNIQIDTI